MKVRKIGAWTLVCGIVLLVVSLYYDVAFAGGFSWDDPPERTAPYEPQLATAKRMYSAAWSVVVVGAALLLLSSVQRRFCKHAKV